MSEQKQLAVDIEQQANVIQRLVINILDYVSLQSWRYETKQAMGELRRNRWQ